MGCCAITTARLRNRVDRDLAQDGIREEGRRGAEDLRLCRIDLATAYAMTALFGIAMVIIASHLHIEGKGAGLMVVLAERLGESLGPVGRWAFLIGTLGAVFSSLLGEIEQFFF